MTLRGEDASGPLTMSAAAPQQRCMTWMKTSRSRTSELVNSRSSCVNLLWQFHCGDARHWLECKENEWSGRWASLLVGKHREQWHDDAFVCCHLLVRMKPL